MTKDRIPTEQELDALLSETPQFDLEAVKHRTLSRIAPPQKARKRLPLRGLCIAAVVCALSVSAVAAGYAGDGGIVKMLSSIRKPQVEEYAADPLPNPEPTPIVTEEPQPAPAPEPVPEPEPEPEPPVLDEKIAAALEVTPEQAEKLRPAVQNVDLTTQDKDITMTVLQTVGDAHRLFLTVRFDFPEAVPVLEGQEFLKMDITLEDGRGLGYGLNILEQTETSVTYLFDIHDYDDPLNDQAITLTVSDYGREVDLSEGIVQLQMSEERTTIVKPEMNLIANASAEDVAACIAPVDRTEVTEDGFTLSYLTDGTILVHYDGAHGLRYFTYYTESGTVYVGDDPKYDIALEGTWSQTWMPDYQDPTLYWEGEVQLFEDVPPVCKITLSPFLWQMYLTEWDQYLWERWPKEWESQVRHADGTVTDLEMGSSFPSLTGEDGAMTLARQTFKVYPDVSDVTAIIINGVEFPLSSK